MRIFHRNLIVLCVALSFSTSVLAGNQTKNSAKPAKAAPTPKNQKSAPKSADKTAATVSAASKKTTAKTGGKTKAPDKTKSSDKSKAPDKSKTVVKVSPEKNKATANAKEKSTSAKSALAKSTSAKSPSKSAAMATKPAAKIGASAKTIVNSKPTAIAKSSANLKTTAKTASAKSAAPSSSQIIVSATSARVRSEPNAGAATVSIVKVGTILPVREENSIWYRVRLDDDRSGWISKQTANDFDEEKRAEIYRRIADKYYKSKLDFGNAAEVFDFLSAAAAAVKERDAQADLSFRRLVALSQALKSVPFGKADENPYKNFLAANEKEVVYSDPSGEWLVRSDIFWETHARFKDAPAGEEIAWLAAQNALPGECEGYLNCYIYLLRVTDGEYLNFYPSGKYARKSLQNIASLLDPIVADLKGKTVYSAATDISDRAEFNRLLTELRTIISKVPLVEKAKPLQQINQIGEGFR